MKSNLDHSIQQCHLCWKIYIAPLHIPIMLKLKMVVPFYCFFWNFHKLTKVYYRFNYFFTYDNQKNKIQTTKSSNFISHNIFFSHLYTCTFATIRCYMVSNHLWITLLITKQQYLYVSLDATNCWMIWLHFSFLSKLPLVTSHSCICN